VCFGYISRKGEWRIRAKLHFERVPESDLLDFMIDSGSAKTILSPNDVKMIAKIIGIEDIDSLPKSEQTLWGVGSKIGRETIRKPANVLPITGIEFITRGGKSERHHVEELDNVLILEIQIGALEI
jgi:hypothetical protein